MYRVVTTGHLARAADGRFIHEYACDCAIVVAGVGGTGAYLAEYAAQRAYAARHLYANPRRPGWACRIFLFDPDTVERRNVARQNFALGDVGRRKVDALGDQLLRHYAGTGLRVATAARRFERDDLATIAREAPSAQLWLFGCVDNPAGRRALHEAVAARNLAAMPERAPGCAPTSTRRRPPERWRVGPSHSAVGYALAIPPPGERPASVLARRRATAFGRLWPYALSLTPCSPRLILSISRGAYGTCGWIAPVRGTKAARAGRIASRMSRPFLLRAEHMKRSAPRVRRASRDKHA